MFYVNLNMEPCLLFNSETTLIKYFWSVNTKFKSQQKPTCCWKYNLWDKHHQVICTSKSMYLY